MKQQIFKGTCTALITPFDKSNKVDFKAFKEIVEFQIENKVDALLFLGTTGESSTLTENEKIKIVKFAVEIVKGRVPVIIGAGSNNTKKAIKNSILYESLGADCLLHITPYYNKCTQDGLIKHFTKIAHSTKLPIIIYNVPSRTGVNIEPKTLLSLSKIPNIVGIKEASGNINQISEMRRLIDEDFAIYSGNDEQTLPILALGGIGNISVVGNLLPKKMHELCFNYLLGNIITSRQLQLQLLPLIKLCFCEVNPIPIKKAMSLAGYCNAKCRLPLTTLTRKNTALLKSELEKFESEF